jgi:hypothetical protein
MNLTYPQIIARAVSDGDDPVDAMHRWYQRACALGANPPLPPDLTRVLSRVTQFNATLDAMAESDSSMSSLFQAFVDTFAEGRFTGTISPTASPSETLSEYFQRMKSATSSMSSTPKGPGEAPPATPTVNVYTKDQVIHNVPAEKLDQMGPETLASVVAITDEIPWAPKRLELFKKAQAETIAEREAKKKVEFECAKARAMNVGEDLWKALASPESARFFNIYTPEGVRTLRLDDLLNGEEDLHYGRIDEIISSDQRVMWPSEKVRRLNAKRAEKAAASKKAKRKEQIDELVSKLLKERNEL